MRVAAQAEWETRADIETTCPRLRFSAKVAERPDKASCMVLAPAPSTRSNAVRFHAPSSIDRSSTHPGGSCWQSLACRTAARAVQYNGLGCLKTRELTARTLCQALRVGKRYQDKTQVFQAACRQSDRAYSLLRFVDKHKRFGLRSDVRCQATGRGGGPLALAVLHIVGLRWESASCGWMHHCRESRPGHRGSTCAANQVLSTESGIASSVARTAPGITLARHCDCVSTCISGRGDSHLGAVSLGDSSRCHSA